MKIKDDCFKTEQKQQIKITLTNLINQPSDRQQRPCPGCRFAVGAEHSLTTTAHCSAQCPYAPAQMSSDPERYPIEPAIVPLVYAFYTLRLMMPCWSCEGHADKNGALIKTPKLWFYSAADFYPKLVAQYVNTLKGQHKIENQWAVRLLPFSQSMFTITYCLEPQDTPIHNDSLISLQRDIDVIAKNLRQEILKLAHHYVERADKNKPTSS